MNQKFIKEEILEKGAELFSSYGYSALGINKVLKQTGMSKGAFYNAFNSKENFLLETLNYYRVKNNSFLTELFESKTQLPAVQRLEKGYKKLLDLHVECGNKGCIVNSIMVECAGTNPVIAEATQEHYDKMIATIQVSVEQAQKENGLNPNIDPKTLTELLQSSFYGILNRQNGREETESGKELIQILFQSLR